MFIKRKGIVALLLSSLVIGGCQMSDEQSKETKPVEQKPSEVDVEELPNTRALQDEFTREMIKSTKETEKGYYTLESKTGVYEMLFPTGGEVGEEGYSRTDNLRESYVIGVLYPDEVEAQIRIEFNKELYNDQKGISYSTDFLANNLGITEPFTKIKSKKNTSYIAPFKVDEDAFGYAAYVHSNSSSGGIKVVYSVGCNQSKVNCDSTNEKVKNQAYQIISSIGFKENGSEKADE